MKASILFKQYVWLVNTIRRAERITLKEINERWLRTEMSEGVPYSRTTFRRHREEVEDMFGIIIECDNENRYYIDDATLMNADSVTEWMLSTLAVSNIVSEARGLHERILLESIPSESDHLRQVVEAMKNNHRVRIAYRRYGKSEPSIWSVEPYCIKLFHRRWYLLGRLEDRGFITLSFDRMADINVSDETFKMDKKFDAQAYFSNYFGVMTDDRNPKQRIVLRAYGKESYYLRDLPLHSSQREIAQTDSYTDFEVELHPTRDFLAQILSRGGWTQVISPDNVVEDIKQMLKDTEERYN